MIHNTIELKNIIRNLTKFTLENPVLPSSECIIFKKEYISANNLQIGMKVSYKTDIDLLIPALRLLALLEQISDNTIEMSQSETILYIKTLNANYKLGGTNDPEILIVDAVKDIPMEIHTFNYHLLSQFVHRKDPNINLSHYAIESDASGNTRIIATNSQRLVVLGDTTFTNTNTVVISPAISIIAELLATDIYKAGINDKTLVFTTINTTFNISLAATKYVNYAAIIRSNLGNHFTIHAPSIISQIKRVSKIAKNEILCLSIKDNAAILRTENLDTNIEIEETITIKCEEDVYFGFNATSMISFLSLVKDTVNVYYAEPNKPLLIKSDFVLGLVMPVKLPANLLPGAVTKKGKTVKTKAIAQPNDESDDESIDDPND